MEIFRAEKIGETEGNSSRECRVCGDTLKLIRTVHFPDRQAVIRAFECDCGERTWDEEGRLSWRTLSSGTACTLAWGMRWGDDFQIWGIVRMGGGSSERSIT